AVRFAYARHTPNNRIDPLRRCGAEPAFGSRDRARCRLAVEKGFAALLKSRAVCGFRLQRRVDARLHAVDLSRARTGLATNGRCGERSRTQHDDVPNGHDLPPAQISLKKNSSVHDPNGQSLIILPGTFLPTAGLVGRRTSCGETLMPGARPGLI